MSVRVFLDSNVLIYSMADVDEKSARADDLLSAGGYVSVQVLNECAAVAKRKLGLTWAEVVEALAAIRTLCHPPLDLSVGTHELALNLAKRYGYSFYDSLILASALEAKCTTIYSEDMRNGQVIADTLTIRNPFNDLPT